MQTRSYHPQIASKRHLILAPKLSNKNDGFFKIYRLFILIIQSKFYILLNLNFIVSKLSNFIPATNTTTLIIINLTITTVIICFLF